MPDIPEAWAAAASIPTCCLTAPCPADGIGRRVFQSFDMCFLAASIGFVWLVGDPPSSVLGGVFWRVWRRISTGFAGHFAGFGGLLRRVLQGNLAGFAEYCDGLGGVFWRGGCFLDFVLRWSMVG